MDSQTENVIITSQSLAKAHVLMDGQMDGQQYSTYYIIKM